MWFVGGRDGRIYFYGSQASFRDGIHPCRLKLLTPHFDHGTQSEKHSRRLLIKVAKQDIRSDRPDISPPPASTRCVDYQYTFTDTRYWRYTIESGLPAGWIFDSATATLSGRTLCSLDTRHIRFRATHILYGFIYSFTFALEVKDFVPRLWV